MQVTEYDLARRNSERDDKWRHHRDLYLHNLGMELKGRKIFFSSLHSGFKPTRLSDPLIKRARTWRVFGGTSIEPKPSGLESDALGYPRLVK
ncbi:hypothetical protein TNCV_159011 [Trichonephila clavipes]|uniref:Uncharacterized protein n=1 Tax=Trichonephila clavipes TaxID=2585209 RepID=A0A8X6R8J8_TRICX|nr:hypothetical protein TNCV_159011 [Trichonephila clavipes]